MQALVIDDSSTMRRILSGIMRQLGFRVMEAVDGKLGLTLLENSSAPGVILCDWNMPHMSGIQFVEAVRSRSRFDEVPIIMVTTETEMEKVIAALEKGANEYVMKPCTQEILAEKLQLLGIAASPVAV